LAKIRWPLVARRFHKWLALVVGVQVLAWSLTGFYMVAIQISYIHGDHLVRKQAERPYDLAELVSPSQIVTAAPAASEIRLLRRLDQTVWRAQTPDGPVFFDSKTGEQLAAPTERQIRTYARDLYSGDGAIVSTRLLTEAVPEMGSRKPPYWQVEFAGWSRPTLYLSAQTGELMAKRHAAWRMFDIAWMLHIMDYKDRSNVNNLLLQVASWSAFSMAISGAWLLIWAFPKRKKKKHQKVVGA
jgi:hypothetical protein